MWTVAVRRFGLDFIRLVTEDYIFVCRNRSFGVEPMKRVVSREKRPATKSPALSGELLSHPEAAPKHLAGGVTERYRLQLRSGGRSLAIVFCTMGRHSQARVELSGGSDALAHDLSEVANRESARQVHKRSRIPYEVVEIFRLCALP